MGQEESVMVDESVPPRTLQKRTVDALAKYVKDKHVSKIVVMVGAGISTSAGIPDFRSPDTGIYANLARLNLPHPEAVFDISYFRQNPLPFYALAKEMMPGKHKPTLTHTFIKMLHDKKKLLMCFSQNIDTLEREAGLPGDMIVEAHGSFATHSCIDCKASYPDDQMRKCVEAEEIPHCPKCGGLVKPDIVFFGESLPEKFFDARTLPGDADLCIVMGTSLSVQPFGSLPYFCSEGTPRLLINLTEAGDLGSRPDDVLLLKDCDAGVRQLAKALGWEEDLQKLWWKVNPEKAAAEKEEAEKEALKPARSRDEELQDEVDRLAKDVDQALQLSKSHEDRVREELGRDAEPKSETELESTVKREIEGAKGPEKETEAGVGKVEKGEAAGEKEGKQPTSPEKTPSGAPQQQTPPPRETEEDARRQGIDPQQTMMREEPNKS